MTVLTTALDPRTDEFRRNAEALSAIVVYQLAHPGRPLPHPPQTIQREPHGLLGD